MNSVKEMARFVGMGPPVSLQVIGSYVTNPGEPISMRTVILRLQNLASISLEVEAENTAGEVPLGATIVVQPSPGVVLETVARLWRLNTPTVQREIVATYPLHPFYRPDVTDTVAHTVTHLVDVPGSYEFEVVRTGVTSTGYTQLARNLPVSAKPKAPQPPPPPPPPVKPVIAVKANGDGSFEVSGSGFLPNTVVHIRVVDQVVTTNWYDHSSTPQGTLAYSTGHICHLPGTIYFSANDGRSDQHDLTGVLWSNTVTTTCSA